MAEEREYVLGTHREELERLGLQHRIWRARALDLWERAGFAPGATFLDVGCGPGFATLDLAALAGPQGSVLAVDISERFLAHLAAEAREKGLSNVRTTLADVQALDVEEGSIDAAYARWVLSFVPEPGKVIAGVARALKAGGTFALQEYASYLAMRIAPPSEAFLRVTSAVGASWRRRGGDPDVGLRVPALLEQHGLTVREVAPVARVARPGTQLWSWPETFFRGYVPTLVRDGLLTEDDRRAFERDWEASARSPGGYCLCPIVVDVVAVKR